MKFSTISGKYLNAKFSFIAFLLIGFFLTTDFSTTRTEAQASGIFTFTGRLVTIESNGTRTPLSNTEVSIGALSKYGSRTLVATTDSAGNFVAKGVLTNPGPPGGITFTFNAFLGVNDRSFAINGNTFVTLYGTSGNNSFGDIAIVRLINVEWEDVYPNQINNNPNLGGGKRMYPDKHSPTDNPVTSRRVIRARATTTGVIVPQKVYFRIFDMDDPSSDSIIDPNGDTNNDNRGTDSNPARDITVNVLPNTPQSTVTLDFTTTMHPGDNFVIAASIREYHLSLVTANGSNLIYDNGIIIPINASLQAPVKRTEMLTVWRKLHVEVDSMDEIQGNFWTGTVAEFRKIGAFGTTVQINFDNQNLPFGVNQFEKGRLVVGSKSFKVESSSQNTLTIRTYAGTTNIYVGDSFVLYDEDDFNDSDGLTLDGDNGENVSEPNLNMIKSNDDGDCSDIDCNAFAPAYITPVRDLPNPRPEAPFKLNVPYPQMGQNTTRDLFTFFDNRATEGSADFWTVYVLGAYQAHTGGDADHDGEVGRFGVVDLDVAGTTHGAAIFMELERPSEWINEIVHTYEEGELYDDPYTVVHEIGHCFGAVHEDLGIMFAQSRQFTSASLNRIRLAINP